MVIRIEFVTNEEDLANRDAALVEAGLTWRQVVEMAARDDFTSERARVIWDCWSGFKPKFVHE